MSTEQSGDPGLLTIDELASATSTSVRTARYYASLGLLPPPERQGRLAFYDERHVAALQLVRALQGHGFSLSDIQEYVARVPEGASAEDLVIQRVMLTPWANTRAETVTRAELDERAGRPLTHTDVEWLEQANAIRPTDEGYELQATFPITAQMFDLDIPKDAVTEAGAAITEHMDALVDELTELFRTKVLAPFRSEQRTDAERDRFEYSLTKLRQLTVEALVASFQRASNQAIVRALSQDGTHPSDEL